MLNTPLFKNSDFIAANKNKAIDEILRGEIAAMEAYQQVFELVKGDPEAIHLDMLFEDHRSAVEFWRQQATQSLSFPEKTSGVWGTAVEAFIGVSKLLGDRTALTALRRGEEYGLDMYREMLEHPDLSPAQRDEVREKFIPRQKEHITKLSMLIESNRYE